MSIGHRPARARILGQSPASVYRGLPPGLLVTGGAVCTSASAAFVKLSGTSAGTASFFRCAIALVVLVPLALADHRMHGPAAWGSCRTVIAAGVLLGLDYVSWAASIHDVGAAITTVLINIQVLGFPLLAALFGNTPLTRRFLLSVPLMLAGVVLASGAARAGAGSSSVSGLALGVFAGLAYAGYLYLMRAGSGSGSATGPVCLSTAAAAVVAAGLGGLWGGVDLTPPLRSLGWLTALALIGQVLAWLMIATALPRLRPAASASILLLQPVLAIFIGYGIGERPTPVQLAGCTLVIGTVWYMTRPPSQ